MISHTSDYYDAVTAPVKTVRVNFYIHDNDTDTDTPVWVGDENSISSTSLGNFNNSGAQKITAKIIGDQSLHLNKFIKVDLQVRGVGNFETITLGYYTVFQVAYDIDSDISTIDLYDPMYMLSTMPYTLPDETFPMTVAALAQSIADVGFLTLDTDFNSLPNYDHIIPTNLWSTIQNTSFRDVINEIAQTTGTTAITSGKTLLFKTFESASESITKDNLIKFQLGQKWGNVNSVTLSRQPQEDNILLIDQSDADVHGLFQVVTVNNQIMDNDRTDMIQPLYDYFVTGTPYLNYYNAVFTTEGHGYYEVGDVIPAYINGNYYNIFITEVDLDVDGGISEVIKSVIPTDPSVNRTTAGGIIKSLYDTEIKVDKQENTITSLVSRQDDFENATNDNFTEIQQTIDDIQFSVQDGGGNNQILNSVGYSTDADGSMNFWTYGGTGDIVPSNDTSSLVAGALSGNRIDFTTNAASLTQRVIVRPGGTLNLTFYAKKNTQGVATVSLQNDNENVEYTLNDDTSYDWQRFVINDFVPTSSYVDVVISTDAYVELFSITDLMLAKGAVPLAWQQAIGEVANTNVTFDTTGITVKSSVYDGAFTRITPLEFAGYDNQGNLAFALDNDVTVVNKLDIGGDVDTTTHSIVFLSTGPNAGMNFVTKS